MIEQQQVLDALSKVKDPELDRNLVELGMVKDLVISPDGRCELYPGADHPQLPDEEPDGTRCPGSSLSDSGGQFSHHHLWGDER